MKKTLLTLACACLAGSALAQTPGATDYKGNQFTNLSANGTWLIESGLESIRVYNTETGKFYDYIGNEGESYSAGLGSSVITETVRQLVQVPMVLLSSRTEKLRPCPCSRVKVAP